MLVALCTALKAPCTEEPPRDDIPATGVGLDASRDACSGNVTSATTQPMPDEEGQFRRILLRMLHAKLEGMPTSTPPSSNAHRPTQGDPRAAPSGGAGHTEYPTSSCLCPGPRAVVNKSDDTMFAAMSRKMLCFGTSANAGAADASQAASCGQQLSTPMPASALQSTTPQRAHLPPGATRQDTGQNRVGNEADASSHANPGVFKRTAPERSYAPDDLHAAGATVHGSSPDAATAGGHGKGPEGMPQGGPGLSPEEQAHVTEIARWLMESRFARDLVADASRLMEGMDLRGNMRHGFNHSAPDCPLNTPAGCHTNEPLAFYQLYHDCCFRRTSRRMPDGHWVSMSKNRHITGLRLGGMVRPRSEQPGYCHDVDLEQLSQAIQPGYVRQRGLGEYAALLMLGFAAAAPPCVQDTWGHRGALGTWLGTGSAFMAAKKRPLPCREMGSMRWEAVDPGRDALYWGTKGHAQDPLNDPSQRWSVAGYEQAVGGGTMLDISSTFYQRVFQASMHPSNHVRVDRNSPFAAPMPLMSYFIASVPSFLNYSKFLVILTAYLDRLFPTMFTEDAFHQSTCFVPFVWFRPHPELLGRCVSYFIEAATMTYMGNVKRLVYISQKCEINHFPELTSAAVKSNGLFRHEGIDAIFAEMTRHAS
eukprot:jgi/Mesvir1/6794/Mv08996-RA.1